MIKKSFRSTKPGLLVNSQFLEIIAPVDHKEFTAAFIEKKVNYHNYSSGNRQLFRIIWIRLHWVRRMNENINLYFFWRFWTSNCVLTCIQRLKAIQAAIKHVWFFENKTHLEFKFHDEKCVCNRKCICALSNRSSFLQKRALNVW